MKRNMISFDWALKRLLRQKANFEILEGFLSELLFRKIIIKSIGESAGNRSERNDKTNCVDILVEVDGKEIVIIELQYDSLHEYFQRMLYGVSKVVTDYMKAGEGFSLVRKVYSINIVHFDLGEGDDYVYHGFTHFKGLHTNSELQLTEKQRQLYGKAIAGDIYPEYYIIKISGFNDVAKNTLDEWIYYLKNNRIEDHFTAQGLDKAKELLLFDNMSENEKAQYLYDIKQRVYRDSEIRTALYDGEFIGKAIGLEEGEAIGLEKGKVIGLEEGKAIGLEEGKAIGLEEGEAIGLEKGLEIVVINSYRSGNTLEFISTITGFAIDKITLILQKHGLL